MAVLSLRSQIGNALAGPIKRWKVGPSGAEVEYWEHVAEEALDQLPPGAAEKAEEALGGGLVGELAPVAAHAPSAAVMEAFIRIERELRRIASRSPPVVDPDTERRMSARGLAVVLRREGLISDEAAAAIDGLVTLRNLVAHGRPANLDEQKALEYIHIADAVLYALGSDEN